MQQIPQITEAELEVMKVLWQLEVATSAQIVEHLTQTTDWKPKTIQTLMTRLVAKGAVNTEKINGKSFQYTPQMTQEQYQREANTSFLKKMYDGSLKMMLTSFIHQSTLSKQDVEDLKNLLEDQEVR
ncbi:MAG: BlaI/MecI/CopY family transcriptional regulator [Cellulosilyticaceae bacterium]